MSVHMGTEQNEAFSSYLVMIQGESLI